MIGLESLPPGDFACSKAGDVNEKQPPASAGGERTCATMARRYTSPCLRAKGPERALGGGPVARLRLRDRHAQLATGHQDAPELPSGARTAETPVFYRGFRSTATGIRTPVSAVRGRRPSPLDDGGAASDSSGLDGVCTRHSGGGARVGYAARRSTAGGRGKSGVNPARSRHCERALMRRM